MIKIIVLVGSIIFSAAIVGIFFPWWSVVFCCFIPFILVDVKSYWFAFTIGFLSISLFWASLATYLDIMNEHILSKKVIQLFLLHADWYWMLIVVTALIGGIVGGVVSLFGKFIRTHYY